MAINIINVDFLENYNVKVSFNRSITQGDHLTNKIVATFWNGHPPIATVRLHAKKPNGEVTPVLEHFESELQDDEWSFTIPNWFTEFHGQLEISISIQFIGIVEGYEEVVTAFDLTALNALPVKTVGIAYVALEDNKVYDWSGSAFVENVNVTYEIPKDFLKKFYLNVESSIVSSGTETLPPTSEGPLFDFLNSIAGRLTVVEDNQYLKLNFYGKATENISKGDIVMFAGAEGDHIKVSKANLSSSGFKPEYIIGIAENNVLQNSFGYFRWFGYIDNVIIPYPAGTLLWVGTTPGSYTTAEPTTGYKILVAAVVRQSSGGGGSNGKILVRPTLGSKLKDLHDVDLASLANSDVLVYDSSLSRWVNSNRLVNAESDIDTLQSDVNTAESDIDSLEGRVTTEEANVDNLQGRMTTEEANVDNLQGRMTTAETDIDNVEQDLTTHENRQDNPHTVTKTQVGLSDVNNTSDLNKPISTATQTALDLKADLVEGKVPANQLPSYVDDVLEVYVRTAATPLNSDFFSLTSVTGTALTPESGKIYLVIGAVDTDLVNTTYRWGGTHYAVIGDIALGTTAATAFPGDRGLALETLTDNIVDGSQALALKDQVIRNTAVGTIPLVVNGIASTTANLTEFQVNGAKVLEVNKDGWLFKNGAR
jgi:predicted  nucleic acid-binding Zn-ribbon protein